MELAEPGSWQMFSLIKCLTVCVSLFFHSLQPVEAGGSFYLQQRPEEIYMQSAHTCHLTVELLSAYLCGGFRDATVNYAYMRSIINQPHRKIYMYFIILITCRK